MLPLLSTVTLKFLKSYSKKSHPNRNTEKLPENERAEDMSITALTGSVQPPEHNSEGQVHNACSSPQKGNCDNCGGVAS